MERWRLITSTIPSYPSEASSSKDCSIAWSKGESQRVGEQACESENRMLHISFFQMQNRDQTIF